MKRIFVHLVITIALLASAGVAAQAQRKKARPAAAVDSTPTVVSEADSPAAPQKSREIVKAADIYKTSLKQLINAREAEAAQSAEQLAKLKELYKDGLISKREIEATEHALIETQHKVEEARRQLAATDSLVVESLAETEAGAVADFDTSLPKGSALKKIAYIRFKGSAKWSVSDVGKIEKFYQAKFKRSLPVAALGQSDLHSRWGYDHRNAVDIALQPDSAEGQALMNYLSSQGIPFMAFRRAVPGSATGPHIHIGNPSPKSAVK